MDELDEDIHPACVNDVASLTENGTSKTLASVLTNNVFPMSNASNTSDIQLIPPTYQIRWDHSKQSQKPQVHGTFHAYITKTLLFSNSGIRRPGLKDNPVACRIGRTRAELTLSAIQESDLSSNCFNVHTVNR